MYSSAGRLTRVSAALVAIALIAASVVTTAADKAPTELQLRTAAYVRTFVSQMSFLLADEQMQFRDGKKVISEFMLIRDPNVPSELLVVRDIRSINGTPVQNG
jgi:hypothetical protein